MQRGAPMWEAAGFLGISEKTLRDTYGHHHPAHLRGAADAIASRRAPKKVALVVSLVEEKAKRAGALQAPEIIGGPGRTRTCNQTVMSGGIMVIFVDSAAFSFEFDRVRCALARSFLERNRCGLRPSVETACDRDTAAVLTIVRRSGFLMLRQR